MTQIGLGDTLHVGQAAVSRIQTRKDAFSVSRRHSFQFVRKFSSRMNVNVSQQRTPTALQTSGM